MSAPLILAIPSKGRLMEQSAEALRQAGIVVAKTGPERGYRGEIEGLAGVEVAFVSASEIVRHLRTGEAHLGITGRDLVEEYIDDWSAKVEIVREFAFGPADVVVAVPAHWLDVSAMADLEEIAVAFRRTQRGGSLPATMYRATASSRAWGRPKGRPPAAAPTSSSTSRRRARHCARTVCVS
jgi:ATP phosphoribosyltransferase